MTITDKIKTFFQFILAMALILAVFVGGFLGFIWLLGKFVG